MEPIDFFIEKKNKNHSDRNLVGVYISGVQSNLIIKYQYIYLQSEMHFGAQKAYENQEIGDGR